MQHDAPCTSAASDSLVQSLIDTGYRRSKVRLHVRLLGVGGTNYHTMHTALKQLEVNKQASSRLAGELQRRRLLSTQDEQTKKE